MGVILDHLRSPAELVWENALLRKQLEVACRQIGRPQLCRADRAVLVLLTRLTPRWRDALLLIKPETILRWHGRAFAMFWRRRSKPGRRRPRIPEETIALIERMARNNSLWGAERKRGELLKLGIRLASARSRNTSASAVPLAHREHPGRPSCVSTARRSGPATSCRSMTS